MCVYVRMYMCIMSMYICVYVCKYMCVYICAYIYVCMCVCICVCVYVCVYMCMSGVRGPFHFFLLHNEIESPTVGFVEPQHLASAWHIEGTRYMLCK